LNQQTNIKRVALITDGITPFVIGGMQRHSYYVAKYLAKAGIKVELYHCLPSRPTDEAIKSIFDESVRSNITHHIIPFPKHLPLPGHYLRESYEYSATIYRSLKKYDDLDLIIAKGFCVWHLLRQKAKGEKFPPIVLKFHGYEMFQKSFGIKEKLKQYLLQGPVKWNVLQADMVWSYGGKITEIIKSLGVSENNIVEFPACIEVEDVRSEIDLIVNEKIKFVYIGRYERRKGIEELSQVINENYLNATNCEFHFIGNIPENLKLKSESVIYHGAIKEKTRIFELLDTMDILISSSYSEGMPNVILEGMARGLAVIGTDVGAVRKIVSHENGILIGTVANLKNSLSLEINQMLKLKSNQILELKKNSISKVKNHFIYDFKFIDFINTING
jgi:glycosyltransferase involved in cell wall biosynthesis